MSLGGVGHVELSEGFFGLTHICCHILGSNYLMSISFYCTPLSHIYRKEIFSF